MAIRQIVTGKDTEVLREKAKPVLEFNQKLWDLLDDMKETMEAADGVGLAAPQVGILRRVAIVAADGKKFYELVNPVILEEIGTQTFDEGCLSLPGQKGLVERPKKLVVEAQDRFGKKHKYKITDAFTAVAFCHEIDHLDGVLYIDKLTQNGKINTNDKGGKE